MTYYDVYIRGGIKGGVPAVSSPRFPYVSRSGYPPGAFGELLQWIDEGRFEGEQVDWGSWEAKVSKKQIEQFVDHLYSGDDTNGLEELREYVANLKPGGRYKLVAVET